MGIRSAELLFAQDEKSRDRLDGIDRKIAFIDPLLRRRRSRCFVRSFMSVSCGITTENLRRDESSFPLFFFYLFFYGYRIIRPRRLFNQQRRCW